MAQAPHVAWVTGGGRGIGRACALALAGEKCAVAVTARTAHEVEKTAEDCKAKGAKAFQATCDATNEAAVGRAYEAIKKALGPPDILVNNVGIARSSSFLKTTADLIDQHMKTNLHSAFFASKLALPSMADKKWGRVVMIASVSGKVGHPYVAAYAASKHALLGMARSMAAEFIDTGVTVNAVCPGYVDTPLTAENVRIAAQKTGKSVEETRKRFEGFSPQGRFTAPEEVAHVVAFLCSEAAGNINGQAITIDGGAVQW